MIDSFQTNPAKVKYSPQQTHRKKIYKGHLGRHK
ncbi:Uncharacterised protein [Sphingobacterium multivorum]|nr:Uncharacterised protein [Sphingobacterium multivorum]